MFRPQPPAARADGEAAILAHVVLVLDHLGVHTRQDHTVFQLKPSELDGRKQCIVTHEIHLSSLE